MNIVLLKEEKLLDYKLTHFRFVNLPVFFGNSFAAFFRRSLFAMVDTFYIKSFYIEGINNLYDLLPGVKEDTVNVMLNFRAVILELNGDDISKTVSINISGPVELTAGMLESEGVRVHNYDLHIMSVEEGVQFTLYFHIVNGALFKKCDISEHDIEGDIGGKTMNWIDVNCGSLLTAIHNVNYKVISISDNDCRLHEEVDVYIRADNSFNVMNAMYRLFKNIFGHFTTFINATEALIAKDLPVVCSDIVAVKKNKMDDNLRGFLTMKVSDLELSVRALNCLANEGIEHVGDLVQRRESDILKTPNFGRKSLNEISDMLNKMGLNFGMKIDDWNVNDDCNNISEE